MEIKIIDWEDGNISHWSGGTTNQLEIFPTGLTVKDDFIWRISTATVELGDSKFSNFNGYSRFLTILQGEIQLIHGDEKKILLKENEPHFFSGAIPTTSSVNETLRDFNFIWKEKLGDLEVKISKFQGNPSKIFKNHIFIYTLSEVTEISLQNSLLKLKKNSLLIIRDREPILFNCSGHIIYGELPQL